MLIQTRSIFLISGIERRTQTAGESKAFSDPFAPLKEKDLVIVRNILSSLHENFKGQVKSARGEKLKGEDAKLFSGEVWVGQQAVDLGLVDGIDTMNNFIQSTMGGPEKVHVVKIKSADHPTSTQAVKNSFVGWCKYDLNLLNCTFI